MTRIISATVFAAALVAGTAQAQDIKPVDATVSTQGEAVVLGGLSPIAIGAIAVVAVGALAGGGGGGATNSTTSTSSTSGTSGGS